MRIITLCLAILISTNLLAKTDTKTKKSNFNFKEFFKDIKVDRIGGHLGFIKPSDIDPALGLGLDLPLGKITKHQVDLRTGLEYWSKSNGPLDTKDFIISGYGLYNFKKLEKAPIIPYAGGGLSLHFVSTEGRINNVNIDSSDTKMGLDLVGGGRYKYKKKINFFTETKYRMVSDVGQFSLVAGAVYKFR